MRFRRTEDERRYRALHTELYLGIASALRSQPELCRDLLRNLAKLEHFAFYEGVEQGAAAAFVAMLDEESDDKTAADMHWDLYGRRDTPLSDAERERWPDDPDTMPAVFFAPRATYAPMTLEELRAVEAPPVSSFDPDLGSAPTVAPADPPPRLHRVVVGDDGHLRSFDGFDEDLDASPATLDVIREALLERTRRGWKPSEWADVVMAAMEATQIPAWVIDQQLATPQGATVLAQAGIFELKPSDWQALDGSMQVRGLDEFFAALEHAASPEDAGVDSEHGPGQEDPPSAPSPSARPQPDPGDDEAADL